MKDVAAVSELLRPYDARLMRRYPVSSRVNSVLTMTKNAPDRWNTSVIQDHLFS